MAIQRVHQAKALNTTRVVPTRGSRRSCARRLTLPYGKAMSTLVVQERHPWLSLVDRAKLIKYAFSMLSSLRLDCSVTLSRTVPSSSRQYGRRLRLVQGSLLFVTYTIIQSIISSEMQVELKKQHNMRKVRRKKITPRLCSLGSTV